MKLKTIVMGAAACAALNGIAFAQTTADSPPRKHHHRASALEDRLDRMEKLIEAQQVEIRDLRAKMGQANVSGGGTSTAAATPSQPASQPEVSAAEFQAMQNQVYEQAAENKGQASVTIKKGRPTIATK